MQIDWIAFTPWSAALGGALIGMAAVLFALLAGRIAGVSGILGGLLRPARGDTAWRVAFVGGLIVAPLAYSLLVSNAPMRIDASTPMLVIAGLLVGFGSRLGSGCTSGHGVCGISRLSPRSLAATAIFMATGFLATFVVRHVLS